MVDIVQIHIYKIDAFLRRLTEWMRENIYKLKLQMELRKVAVIQ